ncbi:hypothetical protein PU02_0540 [Bartonella ancashensis]|uniref:Uncharacterized protein n=1 Tax=Bartonella ancashensis TaxID=1318743 RepID=A0A0M4M5K2_9HYPH|nr:hypothetical protein PU02_0540 [Bartonella ancashensis]
MAKIARYSHICLLREMPMVTRAEQTSHQNNDTQNLRILLIKYKNHM